jgi:serine/threonine protein kinase
MLVAPAGFTVAHGPREPGGVTHVFDVARDGEIYLCKRLGARALAEPWMRERLSGEGRLLALMGGHGAPALVAAGEDDRGPWIVMAKIAQGPLATRLGACDAAWIGRATARAFEALARVHGAGVVHADVSPANVLVTAGGGAATLVDFGLALGPGMPPVPPGPFRGTLAYAAPEVARGEPFDARADLFALAASLLHASCGAPPRPDGDALGPAASLVAAAEQPVDAWAEHAARGLEPRTAQALVACCAFEPERRPASAAVVRDATAEETGG